MLYVSLPVAFAMVNVKLLEAVTVMVRLPLGLTVPVSPKMPTSVLLVKPWLTDVVIVTVVVLRVALLMVRLVQM